MPSSMPWPIESEILSQIINDPGGDCQLSDVTAAIGGRPGHAGTEGRLTMTLVQGTKDSQGNLPPGRDNLSVRRTQNPN